MDGDRRFWKRVVATWQRGDGTQAEVAARFGVSRSAVGYWAGRLRSESSEQPPELLPVRLSGELVTGGVEVRVGDVALRVSAGTDPEYVAGLVRALRSC